MKINKKVKIKRLHFDYTEVLKITNANLDNIFCVSIMLILFTQKYRVKKALPSILPKDFSILQMQMCFVLLTNYTIPIFNATVLIKAIVIGKQFWSNFSITLYKRSVYFYDINFISIKPITNLVFAVPTYGTSILRTVAGS